MPEMSFNFFFKANSIISFRIYRHDDITWSVKLNKMKSPITFTKASVCNHPTMWYYHYCFVHKISQKFRFLDM